MQRRLSIHERVQGKKPSSENKFIQYDRIAKFDTIIMIKLD